MTAKTTEQMHAEADGLDARPLIEVAAILGEGQIAASEVTRNALNSICDGARAMAEAIRAGGVLRYAAAGSSGLMAASDALELCGTFSIPASQIRIHMAGGLPEGVEMPGNVEDDTESLTREFAGLTKDDVVIAVSASGTTPFTTAAAQSARAVGASVIGIANNGETDLLTLADHAVLLATPPEVVAGSTRLGAGTAQKIALNMLSTLMAFELGHVYDGMMVNLRADNSKLRDRARRIVSRAASVTLEEAATSLDLSDGDVKCAILIAAGAATKEHALTLLKASIGHLRPALKSLS